MGHYYKIGELANLTGITVRTLHYYDEIGLLKPSQVTDARHRLYDTNCLTDLYRIIAMKEMGFKLEDIYVLMKSKDSDILELIDLQLFHTQEEISQKQLLLSKLIRLKQNLQAEKHISLEDFQEMLQFINSSADQYFSLEQLQKLKDNYRSLAPEADISLKWGDFLSNLEYCHKNKLANTDPRAIECVKFWNQMTGMLIGNDVKIKNSIQAFHASPESNSMKFGLTEELYNYLKSLSI